MNTTMMRYIMVHHTTTGDHTMDARKVAVKAITQIIGCHLAEIAAGEDEPELSAQIIRFATGNDDGRDVLVTPYEEAAHMIAMEMAGTLQRLIGLLLYNEDPGYDHYVARTDDLLQEYANRYGNADAGEDEDMPSFEKLEKALRNSINPISLLMQLGEYK